MFRLLQCSADTYITNKVIRNVQMTGSNLGTSATMNLFKLFGMAKSGSTNLTELSRLLIKFDLEPLKSLTGSFKLDDPSFWCQLRLRDVYGGEATPSDFDVSLYPLSASFREGGGRDVVTYSDFDVCNFMSSSLNASWNAQGCSASGSLNQTCDYISTIPGISLPITQHFTTGEEDLVMDVTKIVSATICGIIPDSGFRLAFSEELENDQFTYFLKRFGSRHVYDKKYAPTLLCGFNDSVSDTTLKARTDSTIRSVFYNYDVNGELGNVYSGSTQLIGQDSVVLMLETVQSSSYIKFFSGSQLIRNSLPVSGTYYCDFSIDSTDREIVRLNKSGSIDIAQKWMMQDHSTLISSGSIFSLSGRNATGTVVLNRYTVSVTGLKGEYVKSDTQLVRVNMFNDSQSFTPVKLPTAMKNIVADSAHYCVVNSRTNDIVIPYDTARGASRVSSDDTGMFFVLDMCNLTSLERYHVNMSITMNGKTTEYVKVSQEFNIT